MLILHVCIIGLFLCDFLFYSDNRGTDLCHTLFIGCMSYMMQFVCALEWVLSSLLVCDAVCDAQ